MKKKLIYCMLLCVMCFAACQSDSTEQKSIDSITSVEREQTASSPAATLPYLVSWNDQSQTMEIIKTPGTDKSQLTAQGIVLAANSKYTETKLEWVKQGNDTAYVKIDNAAHLTQQSGSEGARAYLLEVTYGLTEVPGILAVNFSFPEGDHAMPGVYTRESFEGFN